MRHRLALAMGRTVAELNVTMGAAEYSSWCEYYRVEPWGSERDNLHAGIIAQQISRMIPSKKKPPSVSDFMLRPAEDRKVEETVKNLGILRAMATRRKG